jgi:O-antigen ligase
MNSRVSAAWHGRSGRTAYGAWHAVSSNGRLGALLAGIVGAVIAVALVEIATKELIKAAAVVAVFGAAFASGRPREVLLFAWVISLTYYRTYFFPALSGHGPHGPYWNPSDIFLAGLFAQWTYEAVVLRRSARPWGSRLWPWLLPFGLACAFSATTAERSDWVAFELIRVAKIALILWYVRHNVGPREAKVCLMAVGTAILLQGALAFSYMVSGREFGLAFFVGSNEAAERFGALIGDQASYDYRRAQGTFGHPNTFALYLLLVLPIFAAIGLVTRSRLIRTLAVCVAMAGAIGLASTLSRTGWTLFAVQLVMLLAGLCVLGLLQAHRAIGIGVVTVLAASLALLPLYARIESRFTDDFRESLEFRMTHDRIALEIWDHSPLTGIGLNNYSDHLARYGLEEVNTMIELGSEAMWALHLRFLAWVHNIYLLMLAETGLLGLTGYLLFIGGALWVAARSTAQATGEWRAIAFAIVVGMVAAHASGLQEAALWIDPATYTFTLLFALVNNMTGFATRDGPSIRVPRIFAPALKPCESR